MYEAMLICFREGLEGFLIVAIATLALRKIAHPGMVSAVRAGMLAAIAGSAVIGIVLARIGALSPGWEGALAWLAAFFVISCVVHMMRAGRGIQQEILKQLEQAIARHGQKAWWTIFAFIFFMVGREGVETATMIASLAGNHDARPMAYGGIAGLVLAAMVGWFWVRFGKRVNLARFFRVTAWFMLVFSGYLILYGIHEFFEGGLVPGVDNAYWHLATEPLIDGWIGQLFSVSLVLVPTIWLLVAQWRDKQATHAAA